MIFGTGTDIVEVSRIKEKLQKNNGFPEMVFSKREIEYCRPKKNAEECFAARFAAKEAFLKALKTGLTVTYNLTQIEIINAESGAPEIYLSEELQNYVARSTDSSNVKIHVSLSHTPAYATAVVIIEII